MAVSDPEKGANGISSFMVHIDDEGFTIGPKERKLGIKGSPTTELYFENCRIPGDRIGYVQLCDAALNAEDDLLAEAMGRRLLPGEGVVDFGGLLRQLEAIGAHPFFATEIFNPGFVRDRGSVEAAREMAATAGPLLATPAV